MCAARETHAWTAKSNNTRILGCYSAATALPSLEKRANACGSLAKCLRRKWLTAAVFFVLTLGCFIVSTGFGQLGLFDWVALPLYAALLVFVLMRFGLLALIAAFSVAWTLGNFPFTADSSTWYAGSSLFAMASVLALTAYALCTARAGRP